jgi:cytochrome c-type biogenesis protein CcmH/NrfG
MNEAIVLLLGFIALLYVAAPLWRGAAAEQVTSGRSNDAEMRKARALDALLDLEADYETGKLTRDEFEVMRTEQETDALNALRELDVLEASASGDDIEIKVAAERARLTCPSCGARRPEEGRCPSCGA